MSSADSEPPDDDSRDDEDEPGDHEDEFARRVREQYLQEILEVQEFIRRRAVHCHAALSFRLPDDRLVAVSAFDPRLYTAGRRQIDSWHLQVVGVSSAHRGRSVINDLAGGPPQLRISEFVLRKTFEQMQRLDPAREIVTAKVHDVNERSIRACARVDLVREGERDADHYWNMIGDVDPLIGW